MNIGYFMPHYGTGQVLTPGAASASVAIDPEDEYIMCSNIGANVCYVEIGLTGAVTAATSDMVVPAGQQVLIRKGKGMDRLAHISATGTTLHIITGHVPNT